MASFHFFYGRHFVISAEQKKSMREEALQRRMRIPPNEQLQASRLVAERFLRNVPLRDTSTVAGYWPIKGELDIRPLLNELIGRGHRAALPCVTEFKKPLVFRQWSESASVKEGRYGIHEPDADACDVLLPNVILVPMLAFDAGGNRLGYGSGFYDRTFEKLRDIHKFLAVGIAFDAQKCDAVPADALDYKMDMIITEKLVYHI